ncbi:MAG: hypothetical protein ACRDSM_08095 [Pseudonocardiaceae bacterium]
MADGLYVAAAKRLLDEARDNGFRFQRIAPGVLVSPDGVSRQFDAQRVFP